LISSTRSQYKSAGDKIRSGEDKAMSNASDGHSSRADELIKFASDIVAAYVSNNPTPISEIPGMIKSIHATLGGLAGTTGADLPTAQKPAIGIKKSVTPEHIVCLEDGKKLKMLKRYLRSRYGLTPEEYRSKWGLPADYPMVAPNYAAQRSEFAKKIGLGRSAPATKSRRRS
jgi:predicted transcriptional regulator